MHTSPFSYDVQLHYTHPLNGLFSGTTWVSQYQKYIIIRDFNKARDDGVWDSSGTGEHICNMHCELEDEMSTNKL